MSLIADKLSVKFGKKVLLQRANAKIEAGQIVAILGPNGAGKSTLLKSLAGDLKYQGEISYNGQNLRQMSNQTQAEIRTVVEQHLDIQFPLLVSDIVSLGWLPTSSSLRLKEIAITDAMTTMDIQALAGKPFQQLSGGEKQRVQIARALVQLSQDTDQPRYLLLDEPTSSLDLFHQLALMRTLANLAAKNIGILVILHDLGLAANHTDQIILMAEGDTLLQAPSLEVINSKQLSTAFDVELQVRFDTDTQQTLVFAL